MVAPEAHPKAMYSLIYSDVNHKTTVRERSLGEDGDVTITTSIDPGTPYADLGSDDGRKPLVSYKVKDPMDPTKLVYDGPPLQIVDRKQKAPGLNCPEVARHFGGECAPCDDKGPTMSNMVYRQLDLNEGVSEIPRTCFLTSTNLLTQLSAEALYEIMDRDSLHIVPDLLQLLADNMAERVTNKLVRVRARDRLGQVIEFLDNDHKFAFANHRASLGAAHYKFVLTFSERVLCTEPIGTTFDRPAEEQPQLMLKPLRYGMGNHELRAPFKLKWDGQTVMFDFNTDCVKVHRIRSETEYLPAEGYQNFVRAQLVCESIVHKQTNHIFPFAVIIAGRRFNGPEVNKFLDRAEINIPGYEFHRPVFYEDINEAVLAMAATRYDARGLTADGINGTGTGEDVVAKLVDTVDIIPCDGALQTWIIETVAPMAMNYKNEFNPFDCCRHENYTPDGLGYSSHDKCMVVEFYVMQDMDIVHFVKKCNRPDKDVSNNKRRLKLVLPVPLSPGMKPKKRLVDLLTKVVLQLLRDEYRYNI